MSLRNRARGAKRPSWVSAGIECRCRPVRPGILGGLSKVSAGKRLTEGGRFSVAGEALREGLAVAWHRRETWWILVWVTVLAFVLSVVTFVMGLSAMSFPSSRLSPGGMPHALASHVAVLAVIGLFLALVGMPFVVGAVYGTIADAIREQTLGPATFWENGIRYFGRAWGLFIMALVVGFAYLAALGVLSLVLHLLGGFGMLLFVLAAIAAGLSYGVWMIWAFGALFVGHAPWSQSLRSGWDDMRRHFGAAVMVWLAVFAIVVVLVLVDLLLVRTLGVVGSLVGAALEAWVTLFAAAAELSLYRAAHGIPHTPFPTAVR
jgi:hypothetical protein